MRSTLLPLALFAVLTLAAAAPAPAIILYRTADPVENTAEPTGAMEGSGWQYEGSFGGFLGTPIGPKHFITAAHIRGAGDALYFRDVRYPISLLPGNPPQQVAYYIPGSDLVIFQIDGTFPSFAPLWAKPGAEVGKPFVMIGRGTQRGDPILTGSNNDRLDGWFWGVDDYKQRWGENTVTDIPNFGDGYGALLRATFDAGGLTNEAHLSRGDSGGAVFIQDEDGAWKLAGINFAVDGPFYRKSTPDSAANPNPGFDAALFETGGLYQKDDGGNYVQAPGPSSLYASQIASRLPYINVVLRNVPLAKIGNDVLFGFFGELGKAYRVEFTNDLATGTWTTLADNLKGNGGTVLVTDAGAASLPRRFYRVVALPSP